MTFISLILVVGGILAAIEGPSWLIAFSGLGLVGPFVLREIGVLRWRDDFQREAVMRSGMHALVAVGVLLTVVMAVRGIGATYSSVKAPEHADAFPVSTVFLVLAITWGLSWLIQFWGVRQGATRILLVTVTVTTAIAVAALIDDALAGRSVSWRGTGSGLAQLGLCWALAFASRRWPRPSGVLLVVLAALAARTLIPSFAQYDDFSLVLDIILLPVMLLLVPGIALIVHREEKPDPS